MTRPVWIAPASLPQDLRSLHPDPLMHALLARRLGAASAETVSDFLDQRPRPAPDPLLLPGMPEAVERIVIALRGGESIGIFGDYDTDGVTAAAVLTLALRQASSGAQPVAVRLPLRSEGYGLSVAGVENLADAGATLLIAVDCGSKDHDAVEVARRRGMDVIILDHHRITDDLPRDAIVASAQCVPDSPYRSIAAAGLAYLLAAALAQKGFDTGDGKGTEPTGLLDLTMIGLVGDVSTLIGFNRALVRDGLRTLRGIPRVGLRALSDGAGINLEKITSTDVAFQISPRLNAPGRLDDPRPAYELLVARDERAARRYAPEIERANQQRKILHGRILYEIDEILARSPELLERRVLIFSGLDWDAGILGLVASKLTDRFDRPVIVLKIADGVAHGSARSVPGFDVTSALTSSSGLLMRHGGHERAAGLALPVGHVADLDAALQLAIASSDARAPGPPRLEIEANLEASRLKMETLRLIQTLGPFGEGNPAPLLRIVDAPLRDYMVMGRERQHLKLHIGSGGNAVDAVMWNGADRSRELIGARAVDLVGTLEANQWQGTTRLQVRVADFTTSKR